MSSDPVVDTQHAHRHFSVTCFNLAWRLLDTAQRTPEEDEEMLRLSQASLWHWTRRDDCAPANLSIGYWQLSRIHAVLDRAGEARRYAEICLAHSPDSAPFLRGYALEALARAEIAVGDRERAEAWLGEARRLAELVADPQDRALLVGDLDALR